MKVLVAGAAGLIGAAGRRKRPCAPAPGFGFPAFAAVLAIFWLMITRPPEIW